MIGALFLSGVQTVHIQIVLMPGVFVVQKIYSSQSVWLIFYIETCVFNKFFGVIYNTMRVVYKSSCGIIYL